MATRKRIAQDFMQVDDDIYIDPATGDFVIDDSDKQHIKDILESESGWWKEFPAVGAAIRKLLKGKVNVQKVESTIKQQLEADGYQVSRPVVSISTGGSTVIKPNTIRVRF